MISPLFLVLWIKGCRVLGVGCWVVWGGFLFCFVPVICDMHDNNAYSMELPCVLLTFLDIPVSDELHLVRVEGDRWVARVIQKDNYITQGRSNCC